MNKRIVIVDDTVQDPLSYFGVGLGNEIYSVSTLVSLSPEEAWERISLGRGDAACLIGPGAFEYLRRFYHFGIRNENYWDCAQLRRLGIEGGSYVKVYHESDFPSPDEIADFMSNDFCNTRSFPDFRSTVVKTYKDALPFLDYFLGLPEDVEIGFDYEGSGREMDENYRITGAAFALAYQNLQIAVFFSFQDLQENESPENYEDFRRRFREILVKHQRRMWVYNLTYETQVTWREFGVECIFCDASVYNVLDGMHSKNYSLKWTVQRLLGGGDVYHLPGMIEGPGIEPWDTDFDRLEDALGRMYYVDLFVKGKKKPVGKSLKCSPTDYKSQPEWGEVCKLYPDYIPEFERRIDEYFGNPFLNMPSDILGKYCCLDSFYTVLIHLENKGRYSDLARETFLNNQRIYSRISRAGLYTNQPYIDTYSEYAQGMMLWGITWMASYRCFRKIQEHSKKAASINRYPTFSRLLLERNEFCGGNPGELAKNLLSQNIDPTDSYQTGLDEGGMVFKYGQDFTSKFVSLVKDAMTETKYKGKIDSGIIRKKKILACLSEKLIPFLGLDKLKLGPRHTELEKLLFYQRAYSNLLGVWSQIPSISQIPAKLYWGSELMSVEKLTSLIMENYYRCTSPDVNKILEEELISDYKLETVWLATIQRDVNKLPGEKLYYSQRGILTPEDAYSHFCGHYKVFCNGYNKKTGVCTWPLEVPEEYPREIWVLASEYWRNPMSDPMRDIWGDWKGWDVQEDFFPKDVKGEYDLMAAPWSEYDLNLPKFTLIRKILFNILLFKKYNKIFTTYLKGLFVNGSRYMSETSVLIPTREVDPSYPGAVHKVFPKFEVMKKETKRSSSGLHTVPSHMDTKKAISCPVLDTPGTRTGKTATLLSYFDIN